MIDPNEWYFIIKVIYALGLGLIIGLDPELQGRPAGIRTHMLICGASCALVLTGQGVVDYYETQSRIQQLSTDPLRIIQAIITGISFVGAGTILQRPRSDTVEGLTTAASLIFTSSIGIIAAQGQYFVSGSLAVLVLFITRGLRPLKGWLGSGRETAGK